MRIRGARKADLREIEGFYKESNCHLDVDHLERLIVAEGDDSKLIAVLTLNTVLECTFLTAPDATKRDRIESLKHLVEHGKREVKELKYELVHAFANDLIKDILKKHFEFQDAKGTNLVLFVE